MFSCVFALAVEYHVVEVLDQFQPLKQPRAEYPLTRNTAFPFDYLREFLVIEKSVFMPWRIAHILENKMRDAIKEIKS